VVADGASALEGSNVLVASNSHASSRASSDCVVVETLLMLAKAKVLDVIVLDSTIANPVHQESRKRKSYELNRHF
jgi:hypothetical protein